MSFKDQIAADSVRVLFNSGEFGDLVSLVSVKESVGGLDTIYTDVPVMIDPAFDVSADGTIETAIDVAMLDGQVWAVPIDPATIAGIFRQGETIGNDGNDATARYVGLAVGRGAILHVPDDADALLDPEEATADTHISGAFGQTTTNYGQLDELEIISPGTTGFANTHGIIEIPLASVPAGWRAASAQLALNLTARDANALLRITRIRRLDWVEGDGSPASGATWVTYDGVNGWTVGGAGSGTEDYDPAGEVLLWTPTATGIQLSPDVSEMANLSLDAGDPSVVFRISDTNITAAQSTTRVSSRDHGTAALRPKLRLTIGHSIPASSGIAGQTSGATATATASGAARVGVPQVKAGDYIPSLRGYRWQVRSSIPSPDTYSHTLVLERGVAA